MNNKTKFFLGANSDNDFISYFRQLQGQDTPLQLLILKGGPGSGKSSLMKRVLERAEKENHTVEIIACASDPESLDAVIDYTDNFAVMDGTAPHIQDPVLPGAKDHIIYTGDLWDSGKLSANAAQISALGEKISDCHKGAGAYIKSASALLRENMRVAQKYIDIEKCRTFISEMIKEVCISHSGGVKRRLLSAVSVGEIKVFEKTPSSLADNIYVIEDSLGYAASFILDRIFSEASLCGEEVIYCPCSVMSDKCDHLIFPKSRTAILTRNSFLHFDAGKVIYADSFYKRPPSDMDFEKRIRRANSLLHDATSLVKEAKKLHDKLEAYYVSAMDFSQMDRLFKEIEKRFFHQIY